jgi:hypothetical protein
LSVVLATISSPPHPHHHRPTKHHRHNCSNFGSNGTGSRLVWALPRNAS